MNITVIQGSPRSGSNSAKVAQFLCDALNAKEGVSSTVISLRELDFPNFDTGREIPQIEMLRASLNDADGLLFVFPEYNGGMPGAMKNALDYFRPEYNLKPMAAATVSAGPFGGLNAWHAFHSWALYVGGILLPNNLKVSGVGNLFDESGNPSEEHFNLNYPKFLEEFQWLVGKING
jgi:NAD(P)H-dependent FMN reductase